MGIKHLTLAFTFITFFSIHSNGQNSVDMGTSVLWADRNVGARDVTDAGGYFCWSETEEKSSYIDETMKYWTPEVNAYLGYYLKYVPEESSNESLGQFDGLSRLEKSDDAAAVNCGNGWRTPTIDEFKELIDSCVWNLITINGVVGYSAKSNSTGNSIFFPLGGYKYYDELKQYGESGRYLSSDIRKDACFEALGLFLFGTRITKERGYVEYAPHIADDATRDKGHNVRPVKEYSK